MNIKQIPCVVYPNFWVCLWQEGPLSDIITRLPYEPLTSDQNIFFSSKQTCKCHRSKLQHSLGFSVTELTEWEVNANRKWEPYGCCYFLFNTNTINNTCIGIEQRNATHLGSNVWMFEFESLLISQRVNWYQSPLTSSHLLTW